MESLLTENRKQFFYKLKEILVQFHSFVKMLENSIEFNENMFEFVFGKLSHKWNIFLFLQLKIEESSRINIKSGNS